MFDFENEDFLEK